MDPAALLVALLRCSDVIFEHVLAIVDRKTALDARQGDRS
jgi:hypothetical protein